MSILEDLKVLEVSIVPKAANKKSFLILKSFEENNEGDEGGRNRNMENILKILENKMEKQEVLEEIMKELSDDAKESMLAAMRLLMEYRDELPKGMWEQMLNAVEMAPEVTENESGEGGESMNMSDENITKEDIEKMELTPEVKAMLQTLWKDREEMAEKTENLEKLVKKAEDEKLTKEYIEIAKSFTNISIDPEKFGKVLKEIAINSPEQLEEIQQVLKGADEALKLAGVFKEFGSSATGTAGAWEKIENMAVEIMKEEKITNAEAITKAMERNPELYNEYLKERGEM